MTTESPVSEDREGELHKLSGDGIPSRVSRKWFLTLRSPTPPLSDWFLLSMLCHWWTPTRHTWLQSLVWLGWEAQMRRKIEAVKNQIGSPLFERKCQCAEMASFIFSVPRKNRYHWEWHPRQGPYCAEKLEPKSKCDLTYDRELRLRWGENWGEVEGFPARN